MRAPEYYIQRQQTLRGRRSNFESQWEEAASLIIPEHSGSFQSQSMYNLQGSAGQKKTNKAYDSTAILACQRFSAVMESLATPQNSLWARLKPADKTLANNREVRKFFEDVNDILFAYRYRPVANFIGNVQQTYMGLGAYGNGIIFIDTPDKTPGLRYRNVHLGEVLFAVNHANIIDTSYRSYYRTAQQVIDEFDNVPESVRSKAANPKQADTEYEILHVVEPNPDHNPTRLDPEGMEYRSVYLLVQEKHVLETGGYRSFPYAIARYTQSPNEIYARGPGQMILPAIKVLNEEKKTVLKQGQRVVDPVLLSHDNGVLGAFSLKAGALNAGGLNKDGKRMIDVLPTGNLTLAQEMMDMERTVINDAFLLTLFQILVDTPQMTATEVLERAREKGMLVAPTAGRLQNDFLGNMHAREISLLAAQGLLPPAPPLLRGAGPIQYRVEFNSPMSRMMDAEKAAGFNRALQETMDYVGVTGDMEPLDWFDFDTATPERQQIHGAPVDWTRTPEAVAARRQKREQAQQQQQAVDAAPAMAGLAKAAPQKGNGQAISE